MKKIFRFFVIIFCVFFLLGTIPDSAMPAVRSLFSRTGVLLEDATLRLAKKIDRFYGSAPGARPDEAEKESGEDPGPGGASGSSAAGSNAASSNAASSNAASSGKESAGSSAEKESVDPADAGADKAARVGTDNAAGGSSGSPAAAGTDQEKDSPDRGTQTGQAASADKAGSGGRGPTEDRFFYYYTKISKEERLLYDAMLCLTADPAGEESRLLSADPSSDAFAESYTRAYNALVSDHPELFWVAQGRASFECRYYLLPVFGGKYKVILSLSGYEDIYKEQQKQLEAAADALLRQVDFSLSDAHIALQLHDLLLENAWYNQDAGQDDYAHTAYGALVEDSSFDPGGALCDGYSLAYEYLLQKAGIPCLMVCGYAGSRGGDMEKHAWNLVLLDDEWYEVDSTWDDLDFSVSPAEDGYELFVEALSDADYMDRIRHYMFNHTTQEMSSFTPGEEYKYVSYNGWVTLLQPSVHVRFTKEESADTRDFVTPLAPVAEGTRYTWDMLAGLQ